MGVFFLEKKQNTEYLLWFFVCFIHIHHQLSKACRIFVFAFWSVLLKYFMLLFPINTWFCFQYIDTLNKSFMWVDIFCKLFITNVSKSWCFYFNLNFLLCCFFQIIFSLFFFLRDVCLVIIVFFFNYHLFVLFFFISLVYFYLFVFISFKAFY